MLNQFIDDKFKSHEMSDSLIFLSKDIRETATYLLHCFDRMPESRERALAIITLEECVMWANKALSIHGTKE